MTSDDIIRHQFMTFFFFLGGLAEVDSSAKAYEIIKSTPLEIIDCHGGWEGGEPLVQVYYFMTLNLCYMFFLMYHPP